MKKLKLFLLFITAILAMNLQGQENVKPNTPTKTETVKSGGNASTTKQRNARKVAKKTNPSTTIKATVTTVVLVSVRTGKSNPNKDVKDTGEDSISNTSQRRAAKKARRVAKKASYNNTSATAKKTPVKAGVSTWDIKKNVLIKAAAPVTNPNTPPVDSKTIAAGAGGGPHVSKLVTAAGPGAGPHVSKKTVTNTPPITEKGITEKGIKRIGNAANDIISVRTSAKPADAVSDAPPTTEKGINEKGLSNVAPPTTEKGITENGLKKTIAPPTTEKGITEKGLSNATPPTTEKGISEKGIKRIGNSGNDLMSVRTAMPTKPYNTAQDAIVVKAKDSNPVKALDSNPVLRTYTGGSKNEVENTQNPQNSVNGQPIGGIIVKGGRNPGGNIAIGASSNMFSNATKDNANLTNTTGINLNAYLPITFNKTVTFGINVGADYALSNTSPSAALPAAFNVFGQSASTVAFKDASNPKNAGFRLAAGPQVNFGISKFFSVSPILAVGYLSNTQKEITAVQTTTFNGQTYNYNLSSQVETKTSGIFVSPKLRFDYKLGGRIGLWVESSYIMGPKIESNVTIFKPQAAGAVQRNFYELKQMQEGTYTKTEPTTSTSFNAVNISGGLVFYLNRKGYQYYKAKRDMGAAANANPKANEPKPQEAGNSASFTVVKTSTVFKREISPNVNPNANPVVIDSTRVITNHAINTKGTGGNRTTKPNGQDNGKDEPNADLLLPAVQKITDADAKIVAPTNNHAINTKGTGSNNGRTTKPNGQDDGNPFPPKNQNGKVKYNGNHLTNVSRETNPEIADSAINAAKHAINTKGTGTAGKQTQGATFGEKMNGSLPTANQKISPKEAKTGIAFRWTPLVPKPQNVTYRLKVWQLMQGQNGSQAMRNNQPIATKDVDNENETSISGLYNGPCKPPYLCKYVWSVQAVDNEGKVLNTSASNLFSITNVLKTKHDTAKNSISNVR